VLGFVVAMKWVKMIAPGIRISRAAARKRIGVSKILTAAKAEP